MADGSISMIEGLGYKALDSNEIRRKQKIIPESSSSFQLQLPHPENPRSESSLELGNPSLSNSKEAMLRSPIQQSPSSPSSTGSGLGAPRINLSPSRKLQQALFEESLILEAEEQARCTNDSTSELQCQHQGVPNSEARVTHVHGSTYQFQRLPSEVQNSNPNTKVLFNARGNSYV